MRGVALPLLSPQQFMHAHARKTRDRPRQLPSSGLRVPRRGPGRQGAGNSFLGCIVLVGEVLMLAVKLAAGTASWRGGKMPSKVQVGFHTRFLRQSTAAAGQLTRSGSPDLPLFVLPSPAVITWAMNATFLEQACAGSGMSPAGEHSTPPREGQRKQQTTLMIPKPDCGWENLLN